MLSTTKSGETRSTTSLPLILLVGAEYSSSEDMRAQLGSAQLRVESLVGFTELATSLRREKPALVVVGSSFGMSSASLEELGKAVKGIGVPWIQVFDSEQDLNSHAAAFVAADDWLFRDRVAQELSSRVSRLIQRTQKASEPPRSSTDLRLVPLIVHDLRTPLNVIGLSLPMIEPVLPKNQEEVEESYRFVEENLKQIERMLALLSDYNRLFEIDSPGPAVEFSPRRLLSEVVESRGLGRNGRPVKIDLLVDDTCPESASLDHVRARQAVQYVLANAAAASPTARVQVFTHGKSDRWVIEFRVSDPAPISVAAVALQPRSFERLCGITGERRGMDLALAARISELFGGTAHLEADKERGTNVVLNWPVRMAEAV